MKSIRVSSKFSAQIRDEALQGKNPIFSVGSKNPVDLLDSVELTLYSDQVELPKGFRTSVATSRMPAPVRSPVTIYRPGQPQ